MLAYRTISVEEMNTFLFSNNPIFGRRRWQDLGVCGCPSDVGYGIVCFFKEPIALSSNKHKIEIVVNLDDYKEGIGFYQVSKDFDKTKTITFKGKTDRKIPELYTRFYAPKQVVAINLRKQFTFWFATDVEKACKIYNIDFYDSTMYHFDRICG